MSDELKPEEFGAFFEALHGETPFPWQEALARTVVASGWREALDIPTGAGKTAAIDIAIFHLALDAAQGCKRRAPVRILFVVDRRLVVDDAYARAKHIARKLAQATDGILRRVAQRLARLAEKETMPLAVARLRGGMPKEPDWARTPAQPTVVVSTVDQVGSRLLFRGYGVSDSMRPIHAGLLGADALLLLDEAHLSQPFRQTVRDSRLFRGAPWSGDCEAPPLQIVALSATQVPDEQSDQAPFTITAEDWKHPKLEKRLRASKPAELVEARSGDAAIEHVFAEKAIALSKEIGDGSVIAVVVNRVKQARAVFDALQEKGAHAMRMTAPQEEGSPAPEVALLIGRARDLDREDVLKELLPSVKAGPEPRRRAGALLVVATQCIEAGADLDFDGLVTEIAPLDCLRQRFGRLNRMGCRAGTRGAIIAATEQIARSAKPDPIYDDALRETWTLLLERSEIQGKGKHAKRIIDFGFEHSASWFPEGEMLRSFLAPRKNAPVLLPSAIDLWTRTSPIPAADPEVSLFLHGPERGAGDVEILWRADINDEVDGDRKQEIWIERIRTCPPSGLEAISVPIGEAKRWLRGAASGDVPDVEAVADEIEVGRGPRNRDALRWCGADNDGTRLVGSFDLRPGDVIVVPSLRGGCDRWGWNPRSRTAVPDIGDEAHERSRGKPVVRLSSLLLRQALQNEELDRTARESRIKGFEELINSLQGMRNDTIVEEIRQLDILPKSWSDRLKRLGDRPRVLRDTDDRPLALLGTKRTRASGGDATTEDDESARGARRAIRLDKHSQGVERFARRFAEQAGLPAKLAEDVTLAGYLHDAGKAHLDFKRFLYGGDELAALAAPDLAKSDKLPEGPRAWRELYRRAGLPRGARHEVASLRFAEAHRRFATAHDPDLVLWLIGTHHGYGRPFFPAPERDWPGEGEIFATDLGDGPVIANPAHALADLTAAWVDRFERLKRRYNPWGLARLEAILRLADHRRSEAEQESELLE